jgi:hypothetical protein
MTATALSVPPNTLVRFEPSRHHLILESAHLPPLYCVGIAGWANNGARPAGFFVPEQFSVFRRRRGGPQTQRTCVYVASKEELPKVQRVS